MKQFYLTKKIYSIVTTVLVLLGFKEESVGSWTVKRTSTINFNTRNLFGIYSFKAALAFLFFASLSANAQQIPVTITGSANTTPNLAASYTSFANFVTALNGVTAVSGPVTATLAAGSNETAPVKGFNISTSTANVFNTTNTLTIVKASGAATIINAAVGTAAGPAASPDGMLYLSGMDGVTIDGLTFTDGNSASATVAMEFGIAFFKRAAGDGCNNNTVQNCIFNMQRINNATGSGPMAAGSFAIQVLNSTAAAATTALTPTNGGTLATNGTNSNNKFYSNTTNNGNGGINLSGFAASSGVGPSPVATTFLGDLNNDIGGASALTANSILNYGGGAATNQATGIIAAQQWSVNISFNTVDNNNGSGVNHAGVLIGISATGATSANATINNNIVTTRGGGTTQAITAISNASGSTAASNTVNLNNNTVRLSYTTATTGTVTGIANSSSANTVNINSNNIQETATNVLAGTGTMIMINNTATLNNLNVNSNTITNISRTSATTGTLRGIVMTSPTNVLINGNTIDNLGYTNVASTGAIDAIYGFSSGVNVTASNNIIRNLYTPTTGAIRGIAEFGISGLKNYTNNQIYNFFTTTGGVGGASFTGITESTGSTNTYTGNIIYALNSTGSTGGTGGTIVGIVFSSGTTNNVSNNAIYNLSSTSTNPTITGISIAGGTTNNVNNNLIGDLVATKSTGNVTISGILASSGSTNNIFHNTVNINSSTSASTFGSSAIYISSSTPVNNVRNNIFVNTSAAGSTGGFTAALRYTVAPTSTNWPATNNNNFYYAGTPAANSVIYGEGSAATATNGQQTIGNYLTYINTTLPVAGRESASVSEVPNFVSTTGSNPITNFLKYDTAIATQIEAGGSTGTGITTDFSGTTVRCPGGGCPGSVASPDRGAWELNGSSPAPSVTINSITPSTNQCTATARTVSVNATSPGATTVTGVVLNYSLNGVAQTGIAMTNSGGSTWTGVIPVASPTNASVTWSVTATNSISLTATSTGTGYQDDPLFGTTATATATPSTVCAGSTVSLRGISAAPGTVTVGTGTSVAANGSTDFSAGRNFYGSYWGNSRQQWLIRANELTAAGIAPGNISALSITVNGIGSPASLTNFTVKLAQTTATTISGSFNTATATQVYTSASYTPVVGLNTHAFGTGSGSASTFTWDGTSNIIVDVCFANQVIGSTSATNAYTTTGYASGVNYGADSTTGAGACTTTTVSNSTTDRPNIRFTGMSAVNFASYSWNDGSGVVGTTNPLSVTPTVNGTVYTVTMTTSSGCSATASTSPLNIQSLPTAPTATNGSRCGTGVVANATVASSNGTVTPTFKWYAAPTGGTALQSSTSTSYTTAISATTTLYVTELVGTCESSSRTPITLTINPPPTVTISVPVGNQVNCGTGSFNVQLVASSPDSGMTYVWSTSTPGVTINSNSGNTIDFTTSTSADFVLTATPTDPTCAPIVITYPVSVYPLPSANVTTTATGVCPGTSATINSGLSAGNFTATCITPVSTLSTPPVGAVTLMSAGVAGVTQAVSGTDDGYWNAIPLGFTFNYFGTSYTTVNASTNGAVNFGASGSTQFNFTGGFPNTANPANMIALAARDLNAVSGTIKYWTEGNAPNRKFIIQYANIPGYVTATTGTGNNSVEGVFYETLGQVDIRVISSLNGTGGTTNTNTKYIGLQDGTKTIGATAPNCSTSVQNFWNGVTTEVTTPQAWRFSPPANYLVTWSTVGPGNVLTTIGTANTLNNFSLTVSPSATTTYDLRYTNATTGCSNIVDSNRVTMTIIDNLAPATTAVSNLTSICLNGSANLSLTGNVNSIGNTDGLTYQWQVSTDGGSSWTDVASATSATLTVTPTVASSYQCLVKVCNGTAVASSPVSIGFTNTVATTAPGTRCGTGTVVLGATTTSPGATLNWYAAASGGTALGTGSSFTTPSISSTTTYYVAAETTGPACSSPRVAVTATVSAAPAFSLGATGATICTGQTTATFTDAAAGANYDTFIISPTTGVATSNLSGVFSASFNPTVTTTYTISASQSAGGCVTSITFTVTVNSTNVTATNSASTICLGQSVTLSASSTGLAGGPQSLPGAYCVAAQGGTSQVSSVNFNTLSNTVTQVSPYTDTYPATGTTTTTVTAGQTYPLSVTTDAASIASVWIDYNRNGTFEASEWTQLWTNASSGTVNITIPSNATAGWTGMKIRSRGTSSANGATDACTDFFSGSGQDYTINVIGVGDVTSSINYSWAIGATTIGSGATLNYTPTTLGATTYTVTATDPATTCSATGTTTVTTQNSSAQITTPPATQTKCIGSTVTFTVAATGVNLTYQWRKGTTNLTNGGTISGATTATLTITGLVAGDAGDYNVVISSDCGSPVTSSDAALTVVTPLAGVSASLTTICSGTPVTITENGGTATSWSWAPGGATTSSITVTPATTTTYVVTATTQVSGCTATASVTINVNETPSAVTVAPTATPVCSGTLAQVNASGGSFTTTYFTENFDALSSQFTAATVSGTSTTTAALNTTFQSQGTGSVLFNTDGNTAAATYSLNSNVNLAGATNVSLTFSHIAAMESSTAVDDYGSVEYSADGGTTWTTFTSSNYTGTADSAVFNAGDVRFSTKSYPDWTSTFTTTTSAPTNALWKNETFTVPAAALTNQFKVRFRYTKDISISYPGWFIDNVKINANGNTQYAWTTTPTTTLYKDAALTQVYNVGTDFAPTVYAQPTAQTQFTATVANGVCSNLGSATINVNPLPVITLANSTTVCKDAGADITIPEVNNTYSWTPSASVTVVNAQTVHVQPTTTTTYTVTTTNTSTFCQSTNQITVNVNDPGTIITQPANRVAAAGFGTSFTVAGTTGITYSYQWQIKSGSTYTNLVNNSNYSGVNSAVLTVSNAGTGTALDNTAYRVLLTPPAPCSNLTSIDAILTVSNTGIASSPSDVNICLPTPSTAQFSVTTNGDEPYLIEWQVSTDNGATYNTISLIDVEDTFLYMGPNTTAVPGLTFEHPIDAGNPNGTGSEFKILNVSGITNPTALKFKAIINEVLPSGIASLNVSNPASIATNLSTAEVVRCKNPVPGSATNLSITTSGDVNSVEWRYDTTPGGSFTNVVTNNTPVGAAYVPSSSSNSYFLAITTNGSTPAGSYYYKAFVNGKAACGTTPLQSDTATITVANPNVSINASALSYCTPGSGVTLTANGASSYSWTSTPSGFNSSSNSVSVTPTVATTYNVTGTDANGCINSATVNIGVGASFTVAASAAPTTVCPNAAVTLTAVTTPAGGQTYPINSIPYQFAAVSGSFTPLVGATTISSITATADGTMSSAFTPAADFNFNFGGTNYSSFRASSDGYLVFGGTSTTNTPTNTLNTSTTTYRPGLAPLWDDLQCTQGVTYLLSGTAPNRVLTVEWLNMEWNWLSTTPAMSFQVKLYETTNVVEYVYRQEATAYNAGSTGGASIGLMGTLSTNFVSLQDSSSNPSISTSTSANTIGVKPATGQIYRFTPTTPITYTYAWSSTPSGFSATGASTTANPAVNTTYSVTATSNQGCTATNTASVTVDSNPPVVNALPATLSVCQGTTATFSVTATSATPLTYQWKLNGVALTNGSGISGATTATLTITGATPANNGSYTVDVSNCATVTSTATVLTVNPLPTATVSGTTSTCQNTSSPLITFTGANGTAPYTFTYTATGLTGNQTLTTTSGSSATLSVPTTTAGTFAYTLVSVADASTCSQTQTGGATVKVNALPAAPTLAPVQTVCEGNALVFGASAIAPVTGVANYTFAASSGTYTPITGGTVVSSSTWDDTGAAIAAPLGFSYTFNGVAYTTCNINLNGYVSFGTTTSTTNYSPISTLTNNEVGIIAAFGRDLQGVTTTGEVRYLSTASEFIVQWSNARRYNSTTTNAESFNFQIHLVKNTNVAYIVYGNFSNAISATNASLPQVGLRGATTSDFRNVSVSSTGNWASPVQGGANNATAYYNEAAATVKPANGLTYTFTPPGAGTYAWSGPNSFSSSLQNPTISNATLAATGTYTLVITNGVGCQASSTVNATVTAQPQWFLDADNDHYYTGIAVVSCTSPGAGYTTTGLLGGGDCADNDAAINPGATEICYNNIDDNCNTTLSEGCAPVVVNMTPSYHNTTLPSLATAVPAVAYTYAPYTNLKYRFKITNVTTGAAPVEVIQASRYVTIPASLHAYNCQYTITASAVINEEVVPYAGNTITVFSPAVTLITLTSANCGATLASLTSTLAANPGLNATGYTFRIRLNDTNPSPTYAYSQSATRFVNANSFTGFPLQYSSSYKVAVQFTFNDPVLGPVQSGYGAECVVNTPGIPLISMASPTCGSQVSAMNANISSQVGSYATAYQFRIRLFNDNGPTPTYYYSVPNASRFSSLTAFQGITLAYNTPYSISVQYSILNGSTTVWSGYGPECKVTTPFFPVTSLVPSQCGLTTATSLTQQLNITPYPGFPHYMVKLEEVSGETIVNSQEIEIAYSYFRLSQFSIAQLGKNYAISVKIKLNGVFGDYDTACDVFTPAPGKTNAYVPFSVTASPNPFANNFTLNVKSSSQSNVNVKVYDMVGRLIEQRDARVSDMETTTIGDRYPTGVYNVVVSQDDTVQTVRVVKR